MQKPSLRVERIGNEGQPVAIIDNFAPDPDRLRRDAHGLDYREINANYPGVRAAVPQTYFDGLAPVITAVITNVFDHGQRADFSAAYYSIATTPPAMLTLQQRIPHIDGLEPNQLAIVHFLCHDDQGGTAFYRHRSTGFETVTADRHPAYIAALGAEFARAGEPEPAYIDGDTPLFKRIATMEPRYNRAIIYRSSLLHCAMLDNARGYSTDIDRGRLTVASFVALT